MKIFSFLKTVYRKIKMAFPDRLFANISHGPKAEYPPYGFERQHISELLQTVDALFKEQPLDLTNLPFDPALEVAKLAGIPIMNTEERGDRDGKGDF